MPNVICRSWSDLIVYMTKILHVRFKLIITLPHTIEKCKLEDFLPNVNCCSMIIAMATLTGLTHQNLELLYMGRAAFTSCQHAGPQPRQCHSAPQCPSPSSHPSSTPSLTKSDNVVGAMLGQREFQSSCSTHSK